jgi:hypothetical protein
MSSVSTATSEREVQHRKQHQLWAANRTQDTGHRTEADFIELVHAHHQACWKNVKGVPTEGLWEGGSAGDPCGWKDTSGNDAARVKSVVVRQMK